MLPNALSRNGRYAARCFESAEGVPCGFLESTRTNLLGRYFLSGRGWALSSSSTPCVFDRAGGACEEEEEEDDEERVDCDDFDFAEALVGMYLRGHRGSDVHGARECINIYSGYVELGLGWVGRTGGGPFPGRPPGQKHRESAWAFWYM